MFRKKASLKKFVKVTRKRLWLSIIFVKLEGYRLQLYQRQTLKCFPVEDLSNFFRTAILYNNSVLLYTHILQIWIQPKNRKEILEWLVHLLTRLTCDTRVVVDASSNSLLVCDKLLPQLLALNHLVKLKTTSKSIRCECPKVVNFIQ